MKALVSADDALQEALLLLPRYDLILPIYMPLIAREILTEHLDKVPERKLSVLIDVDELLSKDVIVMRIIVFAEHVQDGVFPGAVGAYNKVV